MAIVEVKNAMNEKRAFLMFLQWNYEHMTKKKSTIKATKMRQPRNGELSRMSFKLCQRLTQ